MKKISLFIATLLVSISTFAAELKGGTTLYLNPGPWNTDGAVFVAYYWGDANGDQWSDFTMTSTNGIFQTTVPNGTWTGLKFVRMNPAGNKHDWNNKWNETGDLTYDGTNNQYTITGWGGSDGSWSTFNSGNNNGGDENPNPNPSTTIPNGTALYLSPGEWSSDNARFAAYFFGGDGELWLNMMDSNNDGIYEVICQGSREKVIFVRMNPASTDNTWENKWNQTDDLTYDGFNNKYTITGWGEGEGAKSTGTWSVYNEGEQEGNNPGNNDDPYVDPNAEVYTLCGDSILFGSDWNETDTNNDMTKGDDGVWTKVYTNLELSKGSYEYKVAANHSWDAAGQYPSDDSNMTLYISKEGTYTLTFTFNPVIPELKCTPTINPKEENGNEDGEENGNENGDNKEENNDIPNIESYTLVGDSLIFGSYYDATNTTNDMVKGEDGTWSKLYTEITLTKGSYEYKVLANHSWDALGQYPEDYTYATLYIEKDGIYDITFTFDPNKPELKADAKNRVNVENITINNIYAINGYIYAETEITIYTLTGQDVTSQNGNLQTGIYIIKTQNGTSKLVINN